MTLWFSFPGGWGTYELNGVAEKELAATGAHGYATKAQAEAKVNASPDVAQEILLQSFKATSISPIGAGVSGDLGTPDTGTGGGDILNDGIKFITQGSIWSRAVEIVAGLMLLYAGVKALTAPEGSNVAKTSLVKSLQGATNTGRSVAKTAVRARG